MTSDENQSARTSPLRALRALSFYGIALLVLALYLLATRNADQSGGLVLTTYAEECQAEGCAAEEVFELHALYSEECLNEGCAKEEVHETGGGRDGAVAMMNDFQNRGLVFDPADFQGVCPFCSGTTTECYGVVLMCDDHCTYPDGSTQAPYACGACFGFDF